MGDLPSNINVQVTADDCFAQLEALLKELESQGQRIAPAFVFVDPYGFKVPGDTLRRLVAAGRVELFVNVIWRELDMAIGHAQAKPDGGWADTMTLVFGGTAWLQLDRGLGSDARADQALELLREKYGARWVTSVRMLGENGATRYMLAHFTNHDQGRDLMKDCIWSVCPDGGFYARRSDNPDQEWLIKPEPDLRPLEEWLMAQLKEGAKSWSSLDKLLLSKLWRSKHLSDVIRAFRNAGKIVATDYGSRFTRKADPLLSLPGED